MNQEEIDELIVVYFPSNLRMRDQLLKIIFTVGQKYKDYQILIAETNDIHMIEVLPIKKSDELMRISTEIKNQIIEKIE
jgi:hypothetical protein